MKTKKKYIKNKQKKKEQNQPICIFIISSTFDVVLPCKWTLFYFLDPDLCLPAPAL